MGPKKGPDLKKQEIQTLKIDDRAEIAFRSCVPATSRKRYLLSTQPGLTQPGLTQPGLTQPGLTQSEVLMPMSYPSAGVQRRDYSPESSLQARSPGTRKPYCLGIYPYHPSSSVLNTEALSYPVVQIRLI